MRLFEVGDKVYVSEWVVCNDPIGRWSYRKLYPVVGFRPPAQGFPELPVLRDNMGREICIGEGHLELVVEEPNLPDWF